MGMAVASSYTQFAFRFRNDDGSQTGATWKESENVNASINTGSVFRLRIQIGQTVTDANTGLTRSYKVRYSLNSGAYTDVAAIGSTTSPVRYASSGFVSDGDTTTVQLTPPPGLGSGQAGRIDNNNTTGDITFNVVGFTDLEFILELYGPQLTSGDTIDFRVYDTANVALHVYSNTPRATPVFFELDQSDWRWRDDDGSETTATWLELAQTDHEVSLSGSDVIRRLRFALAETADGAVSGIAPELYARTVNAEAVVGSFTLTNSSPSNYPARSAQAFVSSGTVNRWVAVGNSRSYSDDLGATWSASALIGFTNTSFGGGMRDFAYGNSTTLGFVAVGSYGNLHISSDGASWTKIVISGWGTSQTDYMNACYGDGTTWVIVGSRSSDSARVAATATNPSGPWSVYVMGDTPAVILWGICEGDGVWVAVGNSGTIVTATNPSSTSWTQRTSNTTAFLRHVAYNNGVWIVCGDNGVVLRATDPTGTWAVINDNVSGGIDINGGFRVYAIKDKLCLVDTAQKDKIYTSSDGLTWGVVSKASGDIPSELTDPVGLLTDGDDIMFLGSQTALAGVTGAWSPVTTSSSPIAAVDSANLTHGADTTQQITSGTFIADNNGVSETGAAGPTDFTGLSKAEYEFAVKFIAADFSGDEVGAEFKVE